MIQDPERLDRRAYVVPQSDVRRDDTNWHAIERRLEAKRPAWLAPTGFVAVAAAVLLTLFALDRDSTPPWSGTTLVAGGSTTHVALEDGSEIVAAPGARLERVSSSNDEVRVALRDGSATFEVTRNPARTFVVEAADVQVRVIGTRFVVRRELDDVVEVRVERGAVDVVAGSEVVRLRAGESWRGTPPEELDASVEEAPVDATPVRTRSRRASARPSAREAFDAARAARRDGDTAEAARRYEAFLSTHARDERAGLAAFELGRLRMDALGDARGAVSALSRSLELAPRSPFAEDVRARLVTAYARLGDHAGCERARARYLAMHPEGRRVDAMREACAQ